MSSREQHEQKLRQLKKLALSRTWKARRVAHRVRMVYSGC
jgi:hypothetical protein